MVILLFLILVTTVFSVQHLINRHVSNTNVVLNTIVSTLFVFVIYSVVFTALTLLQVPFSIFIISTIIVSIVLAYLTRDAYTSISRSLRNIKIDDNYIFHILLWTGILAFSLVFFHYSERWGWDGWDAWAIWNLHAKIMASGSDFFNIFAEPSFTSRDYPLMLPSINAIFWKCTGNTTPMIPIIVSYFITLSVALMLYFSFRAVSSKILAVLSLFIIVCDKWFIELGAWQYADILVSLFLLTSIVLMQQWVENGKKIRQALLLGFFAASCGWVKNEGLLLFLIISSFFAVINLKSMKQVLAYIIGSAIPLATILVYKFGFTPQNDFLSQLNLHDILARLMDFSRYVHVAKFFIFSVILKYYPFVIILLLASIVLGIRKALANALILAAIITSYFLVYVITNSGLDWNLDTSGYRLFHQVYPSMIFILLNSFRDVSLSKYIPRFSSSKNV